MGRQHLDVRVSPFEVLKVADYGVVGDLREIAPLLTAAVTRLYIFAVGLAATYVVGVQSASAPLPTTWLRGHCRSPSPVFVPMHCIGAPAFCAVLPSKIVFWMVRLGDPKIAAVLYD